MAQRSSLATALATSLALLDQFIASLDTIESGRGQEQPPNHPSPLHLLIASATSLKSSVTKLSLLTITAPFTPSAVLSTLQPVNASILPSLVTAALLTSVSIYPESFAKECSTLTRTTLRDLKLLLTLIKTRSADGQPKRDVLDTDKKNVTEATGKVWEDCDLIVRFAKEDVPGFVCRKAGQWLDLMRDAVKEFEEWDPEEEVGDDPFGLDETPSDDDEDESEGKEKDIDRVVMASGVKDQALKVLSRIPQSIHVVVKQRLQKLPKEPILDPNTPMISMPTVRRKTLERILKKTRKISECLDESAEALYMGNPELCLKKAGEARALTIDVVESVLEPWEATEKETKEDQYVKRALAWIQQVEPGGSKPEGQNGGKEKA